MYSQEHKDNQILLIISNFIGGTDYTLDILRYTSKWGQHDTLKALNYIDSIGIKKFIESLNSSQTESSNPKKSKSKKINILEEQISIDDIYKSL